MNGGSATADEMIHFTHPAAGFSVPLPSGWERMIDAAGVPLIAAAPAREPWRFRPNLVVTVEQSAPELAAARHDASIEALHHHLRLFRLIDREQSWIRGGPVCRTLGHHVTEAGAVTVEQWLRFGPAHCFTLTTSVSTLDYCAYREIFATMAYDFERHQEAQ